MNETRRDFLKRLIPNKLTEQKAVTPSDVVSETLPKKLLSRRLMVGVIAEFLGITVADAALNHLPSKLIGKYLLNPQFRTLIHSRSPQELLRDFQEITDSQVEQSSDYSLEQASPTLLEPWINEVFSEARVFRVRRTETGFQRERYLLDATIGKTTVLQNFDGSIFFDTHPNFATLPSSALQDEIPVPSLYSAYMINGEKIEYFDAYGANKGGRSPLRGAVVVDNEANTKVVDSTQAKDYEVGVNCSAIESCAYYLDSSNLVDIEQFSQETSVSGKVLANSETYTSCLCTFYFTDGSFETHVLSPYQKIDKTDGTILGVGGGSNKFTPMQLYNLCEIITHHLQRVPHHFVMQLPDPGRQSAINTNNHVSLEEMKNTPNAQYIFNNLESDKPQTRILADETAYGVPHTRPYVLAAVSAV